MNNLVPKVILPSNCLVTKWSTCSLNKNINVHRMNNQVNTSFHARFFFFISWFTAGKIKSYLRTSSNILTGQHWMLIALQHQSRLVYHYLVQILIYYFVVYIYTRRYSPLCRISSSFCGGLWHRLFLPFILYAYT